MYLTVFEKSGWETVVMVVAAIVAGVMNLPTAMLLEEQVGWMFHRVCMKDASTWLLPLEMERCCKREAGYTGLQTEGCTLPVKSLC